MTLLSVKKVDGFPRGALPAPGLAGCSVGRGE